MQRNAYDTYATQQLKTQLNCFPFVAATCIKLVEHRADPNTKDNYGNTLAHLLVSNFNQNYETIKELVNTYHADINLTNNNAHTPLQCLLNKSCSTDDAMKLVRLGADPNVIDEYGHNLLYMLTTEKKDTDPKIIEEAIDLSMKFHLKKTEKTKNAVKHDNKAKQFFDNLFSNKQAKKDVAQAEVKPENTVKQDAVQQDQVKPSSSIATPSNS